MRCLYDLMAVLGAIRHEYNQALSRRELLDAGTGHMPPGWTHCAHPRYPHHSVMYPKYPKDATKTCEIDGQEFPHQSIIITTNMLERTWGVLGG